MEKSKWANLVINLSLLFVGAASISGGVILFDSFFGKREIYIASAIINFIFCISFFISIYQLKRIVKNVIANKIFIEENILFTKGKFLSFDDFLANFNTQTKESVTKDDFRSSLPEKLKSRYCQYRAAPSAVLVWGFKDCCIVKGEAK